MKLTLTDCPDIYLRNLEDSDATQTYANWLNDPLINQYLETRFILQSTKTCLDFLNLINARNDEFIFAICLAKEDKHIGNIKVGPIRPIHNTAEVSLFIGDHNSWGKGIGSQAIKIVTAYGFMELQIRKLAAIIYAPNISSIKAFKKVGYLQEGTRTEHFTLNQNENVDSIELGLLIQNFPKTSNLIVTV